MFLKKSRSGGVCGECHGKVASGGNRHRRGHCVPRGKRGDRGHSLHPARSKVFSAIVYDERGGSVAGTGKPSASSDKKAGGKVKMVASK